MDFGCLRFFLQRRVKVAIRKHGGFLTMLWKEGNACGLGWCLFRLTAAGLVFCKNDTLAGWVSKSTSTKMKITDE